MWCVCVCLCVRVCVCVAVAEVVVVVVYTCSNIYMVVHVHIMHVKLLWVVVVYILYIPHSGSCPSVSSMSVAVSGWKNTTCASCNGWSVQWLLHCALHWLQLAPVVFFHPPTGADTEFTVGQLALCGGGLLVVIVDVRVCGGGGCSYGFVVLAKCIGVSPRKY